MSIGLMIAALAPWTPRFDELLTDTAHVQHVGEKTNGATASFVTAQGLLLTCQDNHKPIGACPARALQEALKTNAPLTVWHDTKVVYQAEASGKLIIDYSKVYTGRRLLAAFFGFLSSIPLLVAFGRYLGFINTPSAA